MDKDYNKYKIFLRVIAAAEVLVALIFVFLIAQQKFFNRFSGTGLGVTLIVLMGLAVGTFLFFLMSRGRYLQSKVNEVEKNIVSYMS